MQQDNSRCIKYQLYCSSIASAADRFPEWEPPNKTLGAPAIVHKPISFAFLATSIVVGNSLIVVP